MSDDGNKVLNLTDHGRKALGPLPVAVEVSPAGIERMAAILHVLFAHKRNPESLEETSKESNDTAIKRHHAKAWNYITEVMISNRRVLIERELFGAVAQYRILAKGSDVPSTIRIDPRKPAGQCIEVMTPNGDFTEVDMTTIHVR